MPLLLLFVLNQHSQHHLSLQGNVHTFYIHFKYSLTKYFFACWGIFPSPLKKKNFHHLLNKTRGKFRNKKTQFQSRESASSVSRCWGKKTQKNRHSSKWNISMCWNIEPLKSSTKYQCSGNLGLALPCALPGFLLEKKTELVIFYTWFLFLVVSAVFRGCQEWSGAIGMDRKYRKVWLEQEQGQERWELQLWVPLSAQGNCGNFF